MQLFISINEQCTKFTWAPFKYWSNVTNTKEPFTALASGFLYLLAVCVCSFICTWTQSVQMALMVRPKPIWFFNQFITNDYWHQINWHFDFIEIFDAHTGKKNWRSISFLVEPFTYKNVFFWLLQPVCKIFDCIALVAYFGRYWLNYSVESNRLPGTKIQFQVIFRCLQSKPNSFNPRLPQ